MHKPDFVHRPGFDEEKVQLVARRFEWWQRYSGYVREQRRCTVLATLFFEVLPGSFGGCKSGVRYSKGVLAASFFSSSFFCDRCASQTENGGMDNVNFTV